MKGFVNTGARRDAHHHGLFSEEERRDVRAFFAARPALTPTPLRPTNTIAAALGIASVDLKDETNRFGVSAFKIAGVSYAIHRLGPAAARRGFVCATAGNHGRAVARAARDAGARCTVFVPATRTHSPIEQRTRAARISAMLADGAEVVDVDGSYEEAVRRAAAHGASTGATIVSDTSWPGYEEIPRWIMAGYTQVFEEAAAQWAAPPSVVIVQAGVGGLLCAAASWFAARFGAARPFIVCAEPENAACLLESLRNGRPTTIASTLDTIMAGLRCAEPSPAAWSAVAEGVDACLAVADGDVLRAVDTLAHLEPPIVAGPSGACGVAALGALASAEDCAEARAAVDWGPRTRALAVITEGA